MTVNEVLGAPYGSPEYIAGINPAIVKPRNGIVICSHNLLKAMKSPRIITPKDIHKDLTRMTPALLGSWTYEVQGGGCRFNPTLMPKTYKISRRLSNGDLVYVASRGKREEADVIVQWLVRHWPGVYEIAEESADLETNSASDTCVTENQRNVGRTTDTG